MRGLRSAGCVSSSEWVMVHRGYIYESWHTEATQRPSSEWVMAHTGYNLIWMTSVGYAELTHCNTLYHDSFTTGGVHTATHCNILQHTVTHCNTLQHAATMCDATNALLKAVKTLHCNSYVLTATHVFITGVIRRCDDIAPQYECAHCNTATHCNKLQHCVPWVMHYWRLRWHCTTTCMHTLQHTATHCNTLQHTATHCNTRQHTATHCNTLQHTVCHDSCTAGGCAHSAPRHACTHCNTLQHTATHYNTLCAMTHALLEAAMTVRSTLLGISFVLLSGSPCATWLNHCMCVTLLIHRMCLTRLICLTCVT